MLLLKFCVHKHHRVNDPFKQGYCLMLAPSINQREEGKMVPICLSTYMFILSSRSPEPDMPSWVQLPWDEKFITAAHLEMFSPVHQKLLPPPFFWHFFTWSCSLARLCQMTYFSINTFYTQIILTE